MLNKDLFGEDVAPDAHGSALALTWEYPPFSVLNARDGWWQERKRAWLALGIKSELGRGENALALSAEASEQGLNHYRNRRDVLPGGGGGRKLSLAGCADD